MSSENNQPELPTVLTLSRLIPEYESALERKFRFLKPFESPMPTADFLSAHAASVSALLCFAGSDHWVGPEVIGRLPNLKCVVAASAGVNNIDVAECRRRGVAVCNAGDAFSDDVADYAVGLLIDALRGVSAADRRVRRGLRPADGQPRVGSSVGRRRVGIIGLGSIGSRVATRLEAFGCIVSYHSRTKKSSAPYKYFPSVHDLAADSDVLIVTCALTSETRHIINREVMLALGKEGIIVNIGRGALVDERELVRCLKEGEIGGAGLDVFENEPIVPKELFHMDNVVLSPHKAVFTPESFANLLQVITDNLEAFFSGKPLLTPVLD